MRNYRKFFYMFAFILFFIFAGVLLVNYIQMENIKKNMLKTQVQNVIFMLNSFRKVYQEEFIKNDIKINEKTVHLIPVAILPKISEIFSHKMNGEIKIKLISTDPRNPNNKASVEEEKILQKLVKNHKDFIKTIDSQTITYYKPLYIEQNCLKCHNTKEQAPLYIRNHYNSSYGYKLGDLKGAIVVKVSDSNFVKVLSNNFLIRVFSAIFLYFVILIVVFFLLKKLEAKDEEYILKLEDANKKLEIEKQKAELNAKAKSEFLANMSHEIRTPLNAMFGFIQILEDKNIDSESKKYLEIIKKSGDMLLNIINDILDFSKIESGKLSVEKISFNPKYEIEIIYHLFESKASEKNINLFLKEHNLDFNIVSDPTRIKQVISNLLSNAIKFTSNGKNIYLSIKYEEEELYIEIRDEGIGIPKEKILKIFEPFSQADTSTTRKYGGTGLGLTISYKLIKLLGGELKVESEENKGSRFYFTIPAKKSEEIFEKKIYKKDEKFSLNILMVEDNKANQMFLGVVLKKLGIKYNIANDGVEAVEKYKESCGKYDLILMDENMPNMTGSEATIKIREYEKEHNLKHIFIIALTANALSGDREKFLEVGMDEYLAKPVDIEKLKNILRKIN